MRDNKLGTVTVLAIVCFLILISQTGCSHKPGFKKREGSEIGAKPCQYDGNTHPCVLVSPERLSLVRKEVLQEDSRRRRIYEKYIKADADRWLNRSITIPERGGFAHDFFCDDDGSLLEIPKDKIFDPDVPSRCPVCGRTYLNDKILSARRSFEHYMLCGAVRNLSLVYAIEGKDEYSRKAIEILTKYADAYYKGPIQTQTLEEAVVLIPLAEGYDLLYKAMTEVQRLHIKRDLLWPAAQVLTKASMKGNWGSWHLSAIGVIGYATRHQRFIDFATQKFREQIANQLGDDGLWPESVSTYHFYPLNGFLSFAEAAANNGDSLYYWEAKPGKSLKKMFTAPLSYAYPGMQLPAINDGWYESYLPVSQYIVAYHRYRSPEFAWAIQQVHQEGYSGVSGHFIDYIHYRELLHWETLPVQVKKPVFTSINFPVLGIAVLRQGSYLPEDEEMMMTFDYGPYLSHGHPDKMNITLFAKGEILVPDYGTTGYKSPFNKFLKSTPSHNTIVVDGKSQPRTKDSKLIAFKENPSFKLASARTREIARGSSWIRTVMMMDKYAIVWDRIEGAGKHQYDWFFHAKGDSLLLSCMSDSIFPVCPSSEEFPYKFIKDVKRRRFPENSVRAQWEWSDLGLEVWFLNNDDHGQVIYTSMMPTPDKKQRQVPLLTLRQESARAEFLAVIRPLKGQEEKAMSGHVQFHWESHSIRVIVSLGNRKDQIQLEETEVLYEKNGTQPIKVKLEL